VAVYAPPTAPGLRDQLYHVVWDDGDEQVIFFCVLVCLWHDTCSNKVANHCPYLDQPYIALAKRTNFKHPYVQLVFSQDYDEPELQAGLALLEGTFAHLAFNLQYSIFRLGVRPYTS